MLSSLPSVQGKFGPEPFERWRTKFGVALSSLLNTVLAEETRNKELDAERDSEFQTWVKRLNQESKVLIKRADELDFSEDSDRQKFNDLLETMETRFRALREQDAIGEVPISVVMELDALLDAFDEAPSPGAATGTITLGTPSLAKKKRKEQHRREREEKQRRQTLGAADTIAEQIQAVYDALPDDQ